MKMKMQMIPINLQKQSVAVGIPLFKKWISFNLFRYLRAWLIVPVIMFLPAGMNSIYAADYLNVPLDPSNPVEFYGDYIVYNGQTITLGPNALYVDGSLSTTVANNYPYVFNQVDDDKADVKALRPFINDAANKAAGTATNPIKVYFAPWVYWTDDPDDPTISSSSGEVNRHGLDGCVLNVTYVEFIGLTNDYSNVVICGNRGQSNGSNGNWNVFNLTASGFYTENITYGNYCTVDLVFPLKPELNRTRRTNNGVQAQLFGFSAISGKVWANNCAFVSRLNLTPPAGSRTLYTNCHFESTDDSLMKGIYLDCDFDFYGSMPFGSISGSVLLNSIFRSHSTNESSAQYITKSQTSGVNIDGAYICVDGNSNPVNNKPIEWTKVPPKYLRAYQSNVTLNGNPVNMSGEVPGLAVDITGKDALKAYKIVVEGTTVYNTYNLLRGTDDWDPLGVKTSIVTAGADNVPTALTLSPNSSSIFTETGRVTLSTSVAGTTTASQNNAGAISWAIAPDYAQYADRVTITPSADGKTCTVTGINNTYAPFSVVVTATSAIGLQGASLITVVPTQVSAPGFSVMPTIIPPANGEIGINYQLDLPDPALNDQSLITWYRLDANNWDSYTTVSVSRLNVPEQFYKLEPGDVGKYIGVEIKPKHDVSDAGQAIRLIYDTQITSDDVAKPFEIHTDFRNFPLDYSSAITPGYWTIRNASPTAAQLADWANDGYQGIEAAVKGLTPSTTDSGWTFTDAGLDGAASTDDVYKYGLYFVLRGAQLFYTPVGEADYMQIKMNLNPEKQAGQGFGSAGQWLDIFIKFDLTKQEGYALRLMRISQGQKSVMFYLVKYNADGSVTPICDPVWSSAMISDCLITLTADNSTGKLTAHVESTTPQTSSAITEWPGHPSQAVVNLEADISSDTNTYGGFGLFDLDSNSAKNRHLFRSMDVVWEKKYNVLIGTFAGGSVFADKTEDIAAGETVTLNTEPSAGYTLESIKAFKTSEPGIAVTLTGDGNTRTFTMPAYDITIEAVFSNNSGIADIMTNDPVVSTQYYNVQGMQLSSKPKHFGVYIASETHQSGKTTVKKKLSTLNKN